MSATAAEGQAASVSPGVETPPRPRAEHSPGPVEAVERQPGYESGGSTDAAAGATPAASGIAAAAVSGTAAIGQLPPRESSAESGTTPDCLEDTSVSISPDRFTSVDEVRCLLVCGAGLAAPTFVAAYREPPC